MKAPKTFLFSRRRMFQYSNFERNKTEYAVHSYAASKGYITITNAKEY